MPIHIEPFYGDLGRRVALARARRGMTQEQVGRALRPALSRASVANIEQGKQRMLAHSLVQFAAILGVSVTDLLPLEEVRASDNPVAGSDLDQIKKALREAAVPARTVKELAAKLGGNS